jgi:hypothetical protein
MDKLECPIFHEFDGACCGSNECGFQKEMRVIPLDDKELTENLIVHHSAMAFLLLAIIVGFGGLFAAFNYEADLRRQALIYQEEISLR